MFSAQNVYNVNVLSTECIQCKCSWVQSVMIGQAQWIQIVYSVIDGLAKDPECIQCKKSAEGTGWFQHLITKNK